MPRRFSDGSRPVLGGWGGVGDAPSHRLWDRGVADSAPATQAVGHTNEIRPGEPMVVRADREIRYRGWPRRASGGSGGDLAGVLLLDLLECGGEGRGAQGEVQDENHRPGDHEVLDPPLSRLRPAIDE